MIEIHALTKRYGATTAVSDLTFTVRPGTVTGFLGPNGAGKTTTMRMILGLDQPTSGSVTVNGRPDGEGQVRDGGGCAVAFRQFVDLDHGLNAASGAARCR